MGQSVRSMAFMCCANSSNDNGNEKILASNKMEKAKDRMDYSTDND